MSNEKLEFFKRYCKLKRLENRYAFWDGNKLSFLNGSSSNLVYYKGQFLEIGRIYQISEHTCSGIDCSIGKPKAKCVEDGTYQEDKCAVYGYRPDPINLDTYKYELTFDELHEFMRLKENTK